LLDAETVDCDGAEAMNELAGHGYESPAAVVTGADDEDEHDLIGALVGQLGERGNRTTP
jgi:hypothetical protein